MGATIGDLLDRAVIHVEQLKRIGINAAIKPVGYAEWIPEITEHTLAITAGSTGNRLDPDEYFFNGVHSAGGRNDGNLNDPEVDALVERQRSVFGDERIPIWQELEERLLVLLPYLPTHHPFTTNLTQPGIVGFTTDSGRMGYYGHTYRQISKA